MQASRRPVASRRRPRRHARKGPASHISHRPRAPRPGCAPGASSPRTTGPALHQIGFGGSFVAFRQANSIFYIASICHSKHAWLKHHAAPQFFGISKPPSVQCLELARGLVVWKGDDKDRSFECPCLHFLRPMKSSAWRTTHCFPTSRPDAVLNSTAVPDEIGGWRPVSMDEYLRTGRRPQAPQAGQGSQFKFRMAHMVVLRAK